MLTPIDKQNIKLVLNYFFQKHAFAVYRSKLFAEKTFEGQLSKLNTFEERLSKGNTFQQIML